MNCLFIEMVRFLLGVEVSLRYTLMQKGATEKIGNSQERVPGYERS